MAIRSQIFRFSDFSVLEIYQLILEFDSKNIFPLILTFRSIGNDDGYLWNWCVFRKTSLLIAIHLFILLFTSMSLESECNPRNIQNDIPKVAPINSSFSVTRPIQFTKE